MVKAVFQKYSLRQAAAILTDRLGDSYIVDDLESLIEKGSLVACLYRGERVDYLFPDSYGDIKGGKYILLARSIEDLDNLEETLLHGYQSGKSDAQNVAIQAEELERYIVEQTAPELGSLNTCSETLPKLVVSKPKKNNGYNRSLYATLVNLNGKRRSRPNPRDVLDIWTKNKPEDIEEVETNGFTYFNSLGTLKSCDTEALRAAINRMVSIETHE